MSEDEPIESLGQPKIKVTVSRSPEIENLQEQLSAMRDEKEDLESTLSGLAEKEFDKRKQELRDRVDSRLYDSVDEISTPTQLETFEKLYDTLHSDGSETPKPRPQGVVSLPQNRSEDLMRKPFDTPRELVSALFDKSRDLPEYDQKISDLFSKRMKSGGSYEITEEPPEVKSRVDRYFQMVSPKGYTIMIPEEHRSLTEEELKRRISIGYYG